MTAALLIILLLAVAAGNIGPELVAALTGGSTRAWEYVAEGSLMALLWLAVLALLMPYRRLRLPAAAVCGYGFAEAALRPVCRLAFPMTGPPAVPARECLCTAAGWPWWWELTPLAAALCATAVAQALKGKP